MGEAPPTRWTGALVVALLTWLAPASLAAGVEVPPTEVVEVAPEAPAPLPIGADDRRGLEALAATLPLHALPALEAPTAGAEHDVWRAFARTLVDAFAPASLDAEGRALLVDRVRPLTPAVERLVPRHRRYQALQGALAAAARVRVVGQPRLRSPPYQVRVGVTAPEVATLRERLLLEGYGDPDVRGRLREYFDHNLKRALWRWQRDRGLPITVVLDHLTRARLNEPLPDDLGVIALALGRWRALDLREDRGRQLIVHLNRFELVAEEDGREAIRMRVVVGKTTAADQTPALSAPLDFLIAHPDWRVPRRLVNEQLRPRVSDDPEALVALGYEVRVGPRGDWWVRQPPGPDNALGLVKFMLRGTDAIYLHDSPARHLFAVDDRTRSAGCVRVEDAAGLARWLLEGEATRFDHALASGEMTRLRLPRTMDVHLVYQTARIDPDGRLARDRDIYDLDRDALAALGDLDALARGIEALAQAEAVETTDTEGREAPAPAR